MYFRTLHRATLAQAPERTDYEADDEVIVETTYDSETYRSSMRIVGPRYRRSPQRGLLCWSGWSFGPGWAVRWVEVRRLVRRTSTRWYFWE